MGAFEYTRETFAFTIAVLVIGSFVWFFWYALSTKPTIDTAKDVSALFGGYVAAVLVYYFGQKQAQNLTNQAVEARTEQEKLKKVHSNDLISLNNSLNLINGTIDDVENLKRRYGI